MSNQGPTHGRLYQIARSMSNVEETKSLLYDGIVSYLRPVMNDVGV